MAAIDWLDELEKLERDATSGPWCVHPNGLSVWSGEECDVSGYRSEQRHLFNAVQVDDHSNEIRVTLADVELVAALRTNASELISLAKVGRARIAWLENQVKELESQISALRPRLERLEDDSQ